MVASLGLLLVMGAAVEVEVRRPVAPPRQGRPLALPHSQVCLPLLPIAAACSSMPCGLAFCPLLLPFMAWAVALPVAHCCCLYGDQIHQ